MRNNVLRQTPHVQFSLSLLIALMLSLAFAGCGGGGGGAPSNHNPGGGNPGPIGNPSLAAITGTVIDSSSNPIKGATVTISGTNLAAQTASDGTFKIVNIPLTATGFTVAPPTSAAPGTYTAEAAYNPPTSPIPTQYDLTRPSSCPLPLPALQSASKGPVALPYNVVIYLGGTQNPPPPPGNNGCH